MNDIAGIPYVDARFDKAGAALNENEVKAPSRNDRPHRHLARLE